MHSFCVGDMAVYPGHGVGEVTAIEARDIQGCEQTFYALRILQNGMEILVPTNNVRGVGLREVISQCQVKEVMNVLNEHKPSITSPTWNRRYRGYMEKLKTGSILEVAAVLRDLSLVRAKKELSFGERRLLDSARALVITEVAVATERDSADVEIEIDEILPKPLQLVLEEAEFEEEAEGEDAA